MYWLDYSAAKLPGATIRAAGYGGVIRYIDAPDRLRTKHTNLAEYRDHIANGLVVRLVMQNSTTDADGGANAGAANALRAKAGADYLGYDGVIFFTNDRTTVPNPAAWTAYLDGAASVLGRDRVGAYGFANALNLARGHAVAFWQAGRQSEVVGHANFWQDNNTQVTVGGVLCDRNLVIADYHPEEDMPTADEVATAVWNKAIQNALDPAWTAASDVLRFGHMEAGRARRELNAKLDTLLAKAGGATADEVAAKLLPALTSAMASAVVNIDVSQLDKISDEDAQQIADATVKRAAQLLGGAQ